MGSISGVDSGIHTVEVRVVDVASAVSQARSSAADVEPVVVVLSDVEMSGILCCIIVAVADEGCFPVVMKVDV